MRKTRHNGNDPDPALAIVAAYTHVELPDRSAAIESLPAPPKAKERDGEADGGRSEAA